MAYQKQGCLLTCAFYPLQECWKPFFLLLVFPGIDPFFFFYFSHLHGHCELYLAGKHNPTACVERERVGIFKRRLNGFHPDRSQTSPCLQNTAKLDFKPQNISEQITQSYIGRLPTVCCSNRWYICIVWHSSAQRLSTLSIFAISQVSVTFSVTASPLLQNLRILSHWSLRILPMNYFRKVARASLGQFQQKCREQIWNVTGFPILQIAHVRLRNGEIYYWMQFPCPTPSFIKDLGLWWMLQRNGDMCSTLKIHHLVQYWYH